MAKKLVRTNSQYFENNVNKDEYVNSIVFIEDTLQIWTNNKYYAANIDWSNVLNNPIQTEGDGNKFLSDDGTYKSVTAEAIKFSSNTQLKFYCVESVTVIVGEDVEDFAANSMVSKTLKADEMFSIIPTSDNSILTLDAWPGPLQQWYSWLDGVSLFSNIIFNMNVEELYTKWNQGHQGQYHVQFAQYKNCIFWSDLAYISDVNYRTNYTLYYSTELPLCYSQIPDNTFKSFYLAYNAVSDPNWSNPVYKESFSKATWATQVFSYYGVHSIGIFDMSTNDFNIVLPKDCRGLCYHAPNIRNVGVLDALNTTNFGAKSGSWRDAFADCTCLENLYIINLKVNLNISWSPINQESIYFIVNRASNTNKITISLSPYTYYGLSQETKDLAASKNITLELITSNYKEDKRLTAINLTGDGNSYLSNDGTYKSIIIPEIPSLDGYAKIEDIPVIPTKLSEFENDCNFVSLEMVKLMIQEALASLDMTTDPDIPESDIPLDGVGSITENNSIIIDETQLENGTYTLRYIDSNDNIIENFNEITSFEINK